jgi:predicted outer membrane protein
MKALSTACAALLPTLTAGRAAAQISPADQMFAATAAGAQRALVDISQLAVTTADSPRVRAFAVRIVTDNSQATQALEDIARQQDLGLPAGLDPLHHQIEQRRRVAPARPTDIPPPAERSHPSGRPGLPTSHA